MSDKDKKKDISLEEIKAIDTMCRPFYPSTEHLKAMFQSYEFQTMAATTFGGVLKKAGIDKLEEAWKAMLAMGVKGSMDGMLAEMEQVGVEYVFIDQMVQWSQRDQKYVSGYATIEEIAGWIKESGGKVVGGVGYNPLKIEESLKEIDRAVKDYNFKYVWIQTGSFGLKLNDKRYYPLYAKCLELGIPVCMQTGQSAEPLPTDQLRPMFADEVAIHFPNLVIVLTHTGWPWVSEWISMVWRHPNVYGNIGAYMPSSLDPALVRFMDGPGRQKVLWGTNGLGLTRCKKELLELPIKDASKKAVLYDNARRVFRV
ncbi:amidohydrolase family protein [Desulfoscipio gibsoniae]|uniref:Putative TIM-barrel fold metal-dependent hydrolase n=1 Tax=Desulfoscipio gibsoniae DSM 7213 TaxID=767817 RepID=R4KA57_9FIRM|nr:amidohydrolase family protein [Desulfoscipio gibsoniae]AGL00048.1 putative TIM-barrel fold metal-dependent hydrolase [Desulfoscipio gibsoniae DSM 7213]